jgi:hypothetical protein
MEMTQPEILRKYHDAVRANDPKATEYIEEWERDVRVRLDVLQSRSDEHREQAKVIVESKKRGFGPVYAALIEDYRMAVELAKEISRVKAEIRGMKNGRS